MYIKQSNTMDNFCRALFAPVPFNCHDRGDTLSNVQLIQRPIQTRRYRHWYETTRCASAENVSISRFLCFRLPTLAFYSVLGGINSNTFIVVTFMHERIDFIFWRLLQHCLISTCNLHKDEIYKLHQGEQFEGDNFKYRVNKRS